MTHASIAPAVKICSKCKEGKPHTAFGPDKRQRDGLHSYCRACKVAIQQAIYRRDPEAARAAQNARRAANPELYKARENRSDKKRRENPDYLKNVRESVTARLMQLHRERALEHTCGVCGVVFCPLFGRHSWITTCSDQCSDTKAKRTRYLKVAKRRALTRGAAVEDVDLFTVCDRDGWRCYLCGEATPRELRGTRHARAPEVDHIIPLSRGGAHSYSNTACACRECNNRKGDSVPPFHLVEELTMAIENQADLAHVAKLIEELKVAVGLVPAPDQPKASDDAAPPPAEAEDTAKFATPALASSSPASVPTIEVVDEADVPDEVKAGDEAKG